MAIWSAEINILERLRESLRRQLPDLERELERLIKADDENMILLYSRRCLEVMITDLCECKLKRPRKTEPLKGIIDKLHKEEKVPSHIISSMLGLNEMSTYGAHPKEFDPEQIKPVLVNLGIIIRWYYKYRDFQIAGKSIPEEEMFKSKNSEIFLKEKSIIVLPFENISSDPDQEYFSDGLTEEIITDLSHINDLMVISRSSAMTFKGARASIKEITNKVHVRYVLEGSVRKAGNDIRITAQLIDGLTDTHIWADKFNGNLDDIFKIQEDVSRSIVESLKLKISVEEKVFISKSPTKNLEAYNYYLKGRFFSYFGSADGMVKSAECYKKALSLDPDYVLAYAGLADNYYVQATFGWLPLVEGLSMAKENAKKALDIDLNLAETHAVLGVIYGSCDWKYEEAIKELSLAIRLNPKCMCAHQYYAGLLDALGQNDKARIQINIAIEIDPSFFYLYILSAQLHYNSGNLMESLGECLKAIEMYPDFKYGYMRAFRIYLRQDEELKAVEIITDYLKRDRMNKQHIENLQEIYRRSGLTGLLNWVIDWEIKENNPDLYLLATWHILLSKKEQSLRYLEEAIEKRMVAIPMINNDPDFDILHLEPKYQDLIEKMNLAEYVKK
jgi:TolB-like protein/tetratricopeptide (TPR) repeat protein